MPARPTARISLPRAEQGMATRINDALPNLEVNDTVLFYFHVIFLVKWVAYRLNATFYFLIFSNVLEHTILI